MNRRLRAIFFVVTVLVANARSQAGPNDIPRRIRVSYKVLDGLAIKRALPPVPCSAEKAHQKGTGTIGLLVDYDGTMKSTTPISGDPVLIECATRAINEWRYEPYSVDGTYVQVESRVVMKFTVKRAVIVIGNR